MIISLTKIVNWVASLSSIIGLIVFYLYSIYVYNKVGHMPKFNNPDPMSAEIVSSYKYIHMVLDFLLYLTILWPITSLVQYMYIKSLNKIQLLLYIIGLFLTVLALIYDPIRLFEWFAD
jgi:hypothetical protein